MGYNSWEEVVKDSKEKMADDPLRHYVDFFENNDPQEILKSVESSEAKESNGYPSLSTVHQAKGLEWDIVQLSSDIGHTSEEGENKKSKEETLKLLYVALTRAKKTLIVPEAILKFCQPPAEQKTNGGE